MSRTTFCQAGLVAFSLLTLGAGAWSSESPDTATTPAPASTSTVVAVDVAVDASIDVADGEPWILYQARTTYEKVFLVRPDGTGLHSPTLDLPGTHQTNPDWSPDGHRLTFIMTENATEDLWIANVDGTNAERVVDCEDPCTVIDDPSWSEVVRQKWARRSNGARDKTAPAL